MRAFAAWVMEQLAANRSQLRRANFEFERWLALVEDQQVLDASLNSSFPLHPAHYWTHRDGVEAVDFVGRVESFEPDFNRLCATFGIVPGNRANANVTAHAEALAGGRDGYRYAERISRPARRRIEQLFAADFELLGYPRAGRRAPLHRPRRRGPGRRDGAGQDRQPA